MTLLKRHSGKPFVMVNMAMSADGKIATATREVSSFGSKTDQLNMLRLRSTVDAVMAGARTVDSDAVTMGPGGVRYRARRVKQGLAEYNLRIVVSRRATLNPDAEIFAHTFSPIIVLTTEAASRARLSALRKHADVRICGEEEIEWLSTLRWLRRQHGVERLLCEGGGELNDALFAAEVVDELHLTVCPVVFGGRNAPTIRDGLGAPQLSSAARLRLRRVRRVGTELYFTFQVKHGI